MKRAALLIVLAGISMCLNAQCWKMVSAGLRHSVGVKNDGSLWHWGDGIGVTPIQFGAVNNWKVVFISPNSNSGSNYFGIKTDGSLWVFGQSTVGQLGLGPGINNTGGNFIRIGIDNDWEMIQPGYTHCVAIKTNGTIWVWGQNHVGQLGLGDFINREVPTQLGTSNDWYSINVFAYNNFAIKSSGTLWGWGNNNMYQLGLGNQNSQNVPTQVGTDNDWMSVSLGLYNAFGIKSGKLYKFGREDIFPGPMGVFTQILHPSPIQVGSQQNWAFVSAGINHHIATSITNFVFTHQSKGENSNGELGTGNYVSQNNLTTISGSNTFMMVSSFFHNLALSSNGDLWVWGDNDYNRLGVAAIANSNIPILIPCPVSTLPVSLISFSATKTQNGTHLTWQTATETNNNGFDIEKSTDGTSFSKIGFVAGTNNSTVTKQYQYTDNAICSGKQFYRLKQIDNNGNFKYSDVVTVSCDNSSKIIVAPNPASSIVKIIAENVTAIKLFSSTGTLVSQGKSSAGNTHPIDINKLPAGLYWVRLRFKDGTQTTEKIQVIH